MVDKPEQVTCVAEYLFQVVFEGRITGFADEQLERSNDECERSAKFVANVGEEAEFKFVEMLFLLPFQVFLFCHHARTLVGDVQFDDVVEECQCGDKVNGVSPPSLPQRWLYCDLPFGGCSPRRASHGGLYLERIRSGREGGVDGRADACRFRTQVPCFVHSFQPVTVMCMLGRVVI